MKKIKIEMFFPAPVLAAVLFSASCLSCGPVTDPRNFSGTDLFPPVITGALPVDEKTVELSFNENIEIDAHPEIIPPLGEVKVTSNENKLVLSMSEPQSAGQRYVIEASVRDGTGNSMSFLMPFYGFNPDIPGILINELTTQGSTEHPDLVELFVTSAGNLAGLWIVEGTTDYPEAGLSFASCPVEEGELILVHFKPRGTAEEIDEYGQEKDLSGGYDSSPVARDFWVEGGSGLSGNNGVVAVYSAPGGRLLDGILYSNRTSASDENYSGFGSSRMLDKAQQLCGEGGWIGTGDEGRPRPEDAVDPEDSTATRSICRNAVPRDTDTAADWHIVPTSGSTFGETNTDEIYQPD